MKRASPLAFTLLAVVLLLYPFSGWSQYFDTGQDPASLRWRQITTTHFRIIFPDDAQNQGQRLAHILEQSLPAVSASLHHTLRRRLPVIIHNHSMISNGLVSRAPGRMELYTTNPYDQDAQDWLEQLAIHELRHAVQLDKIDKGPAHALYYIFGDQMVAALTGLYIPSWFLEGDAVIAETAFGPAGRGRDPDFCRPLRTQLLQKGKYSYDKAVFGSYKDVIPDRYTLGYHLITASRSQHNPHLWESAIKKVSKNPFIPNPFTRSLKKQTSLGLTAWYNQQITFLDSLWQHQYKLCTFTPSREIPVTSRNAYCDYDYAAYMDDGGIFALKTSIDDIPRFISIDSLGRESVLFTPGDYLDDGISYQDGLIYWMEYVPDVRWDNRTFTCIKIFDTRTGKIRKPWPKARWSGAAPAPDGHRIAVLEHGLDNQSALLVIDAITGAILNRTLAPDRSLFLSPSWNEEGTHLVLIQQDSSGKRMVLADPATHTLRGLSSPSFGAIDDPFFMDGNIIFEGGSDGITNVYSLDTATGNIIQLISSRFGAENPTPSPDNTSLLYADYTSSGYRLTEIRLQQALNIPLQENYGHAPRFDTLLARQEGGLIHFPASSDSFPSRRYHKALHLFHPHSWAPLFIDAGNTTIEPGISLMSQNLLNTSFITLGYRYNRFEQTGTWTGRFEYKGWYPVLTLDASDGMRSYTVHNPETGASGKVAYREREIKGGAYIPLQLTRNRFYRGLIPSLQLSTHHLYAASVGTTILLPSIRSATFGVNAYQILRYTDKDLIPRLGLQMRAVYRHSLPGDLEASALTGQQTIIYLPGPFRHHGITLSGGSQWRTDAHSYRFSDFLAFPRGVDNFQSGNQYQLLSASYTFPILYPDLSVPGLVYQKRIHGSFFMMWLTMERKPAFPAPA